MMTEKIGKTVLMCDPASGWKYGFPKPIPQDRLGDVENWLIEEGYPEEMAKSLPYVRYWEGQLDG